MSKSPGIKRDTFVVLNLFIVKDFMLKTCKLMLLATILSFQMALVEDNEQLLVQLNNLSWPNWEIFAEGDR